MKVYRVQDSGLTLIASDIPNGVEGINVAIKKDILSESPTHGDCGLYIAVSAAGHVVQFEVDVEINVNVQKTNITGESIPPKPPA